MAKLEYYINSNESPTVNISGNSISEIDVALGNVSGVSFEVVSGRNPDIDTGTTPEDIWLGGGLYEGFKTTGAETLDIVSTDPQDNSVGSGARTIRIFGLDISYNEITEDVVLNGVTPVTTISTFFRVNKVIVLTAGVDGVNQGQINITQTTSSIVMGIIGSLIGNTLQTTWTVPSGKTYYLRRINSSLVDAPRTFSNIILQRRLINGAWNSLISYNINQSGGQTDIETSYIGEFPEKTDIKLTSDTTNSNNTDISAVLFFLVVDN